MATVTHVKSAPKTIYTTGQIVDYISKTRKTKGKVFLEFDRTLPKDENDKPFIHEGQSFYIWRCKFGLEYSKTPPTERELIERDYFS